jgi:hypothetical protein
MIRRAISSIAACVVFMIESYGPGKRPGGLDEVTGALGRGMK